MVVIRVLGGRPTVISRKVYKGRIIKVRPSPRNSITVAMNNVTVAEWAEWGSRASASRAPVVEGTIGVTVGNSHAAVRA